MECSWQVEISEFRRKVLAKHWPKVRRWNDVRTFPPDPVSDWKVDLICGGFPCQDISSLGNKEGITGEQSGLWKEYARIVRVLRPRYVLVENVESLLVRGLSTVLGDLAEIGYDAEWEVLPSSAFDAPIQAEGRSRVWIVAESNKGGQRRQGLSRGPERQILARPAGSHRPGRRIPGAASDHWKNQSGILRVAPWISQRVDRIAALGDAVCPQVAQWLGERILEYHRKNKKPV